MQKAPGGGGESASAALRNVLDLISEQDPPLHRLVSTLATAPAARDAILSMISSRLIAIHKSKGMEGDRVVDLKGLRSVDGRNAWKGVLWKWSVGLLTKIEEDDPFTGESIEIRYNTRTRQPVCAELASLASMCLSWSVASTQHNAVANHMAYLDAIASEDVRASSEAASPLVRLLRLTGCCWGTLDDQPPKALDWLLVVLGRSHAHNVISWLVACVVRGQREGSNRSDVGRCVAAGSWSENPAARALDALCQLRGEAVRSVVVDTVRGLPAGGWVLMEGMLRMCAECPRVFREVMTQDLLGSVVTHEFVREVAEGASDIPEGAARKIAGLLMQRAGLMGVRVLCCVMAMLTPSGLVCQKGSEEDQDGKTKRMRGLEGQRLLYVGAGDTGASKGGILTSLSLPVSIWGEGLRRSARECHDFVLASCQMCVVRNRHGAKATAGNSASTLADALHDGASSIVRALSPHTSGLAARCCRAQDGGGDEGGDRDRVGDWLELIALQEGKEASCAVVEGLLVGEWDVQGRALFERVVGTLRLWDADLTVLAAQRYLNACAEQQVGRRAQGGSVKMIRHLLYSSNSAQHANRVAMHPEALVGVWEGAVKLLCSEGASPELAAQLLALLSDTIQEVRLDKDAPDTWVLVMRMAVDACQVLDAVLDMEAACSGDDIAVWAAVVEDCKRLLAQLVEGDKARHHTKVEVAELLLDKLVKLRDDRGVLMLGMVPIKAAKPAEVGAAPVIGAVSGKAVTLLEENRIMSGAATQGSMGINVNGAATMSINVNGAAAQGSLKAKVNGAVPPAQESVADKIRRERAAAQAQLAEGDRQGGTDYCSDVASLLPSRHMHMVDTLRRCFDGACSYITDALLAHLTTHHVVPSIDQYKELLPKRSGHEYDLHIHTKFAEAPALLCLLDAISNDISEFKRCWQVARSLLANCLGYWHSIRDNKIDTQRHAGQIVVTVHILECMGRAQWLSAPWDLLNEFIHSLTPSEIVRVLLAVWETLIRFPPQAGPYSPSALEGETIRIKPIFMDNIVTLAPYYARFFPATHSQLSEELPQEEETSG